MNGRQLYVTAGVFFTLATLLEAGLAAALLAAGSFFLLAAVAYAAFQL